MRYRLNTLVLAFSVVALGVFAGVKGYQYRVLQNEYLILNSRMKNESLVAESLEVRLDGAEEGIRFLASLVRDKEQCDRVMRELNGFESDRIGAVQFEFDDEYLKMYSFFEHKYSDAPRKSIQLLVDVRTNKLIDMKSHQGRLQIALPPRIPPTIEYLFPNKPRKYVLVRKTGFFESQSPGQLDKSKLPE